ncbi:hypothetical protein [Sneathiella sp.]|jgi:hypothetical protein|uniref:hypothetical protein n=1 Tax=Sneathiella sp. TaxID=1964365 RepID=UPI0039E3B026
MITLILLHYTGGEPDQKNAAYNFDTVWRNGWIILWESKRALTELKSKRFCDLDCDGRKNTQTSKRQKTSDRLCPPFSYSARQGGMDHSNIVIGGELEISFRCPII